MAMLSMYFSNYCTSANQQVTTFEAPAIAMATSDVPYAKPIDKQFLNCGICLERYQTPKVLPCLHTFCERCLGEYIPPQSLTLTCPICRQQSILPERGVAALQNNFFISNLMEVLMEPSLCTCCHRNASATSKCTDCGDLLCMACTDTHRGVTLTRSHHVVSLSELAMSEYSDSDGRAETALMCPSHDSEQLRFYCETCETAICDFCAELEHVDHAVTVLADAIQEHRSSLRTLLDKVNAKIPLLRDALAAVGDVSASLAARAADAEAEVSAAFERVAAAAREREARLLDDVRLMHAAKQDVLLQQREQLENSLASFSSCVDFTENALRSAGETEILLVKKQMSEKLLEFAEKTVGVGAVDENDRLAFSGAADCDLAAASLRGVGAVATTEEERSFNGFCSHYVSGKIRRSTTFETAGESPWRQSEPDADAIRPIDKSSPELRHLPERYQTPTAEHPCRRGVAALQNEPSSSSEPDGGLMEIVASARAAPDAGRVVAPTVADGGRGGDYELSYVVAEEGRYHMSIRLYGQHIKGSPFKIRAKSEDRSSGDRPSSSKIPRTAVRQKATKRPPSARSGGSNRKSNPIEDDLVRRSGAKGRNRGEFTNPQGVFCTPGGRVVVADSNNQNVQVFTAAGDFKFRFGIRGRSPGQLQRPTGVAVMSNGNVVVADYENKWVSIFAPDGKFVSKIGSGKLLGPKGVAVDRNNHIIVVDNKASCVFVFQPNGKLIHKFGCRGNDEHQFAGPHFVAVNAKNDIVISDFHNHAVKVFDSEGGFLFSFGSNGEGNGQFNAPTGVAVDKLGNILVADWGNSRIQVFDSQGSFLSYINTTGDPLYGPQGLTVTSDGHVVVADSGNHCFKIYKYLQ
ncbi:PREDICTED: tripartite motif-containing protein 2-like [Priapulus caudatus]|uniref:Tripartite motif-containing protein 2-like n=1 Tax=Priapulus caudatus TaxID=37621 RepID=A0ABM1DVZ1_PRICU|nr:PREDICTED: tripartite motif-containing protein 2-like [Priapulus caudatus]